VGLQKNLNFSRRSQIPGTGFPFRRPTPRQTVRLNFIFSRSQLLRRAPARRASCMELQRDKQETRRSNWRWNSSECTVSQEWLWLLCGDSSGIQEKERTPFEAGTRGLVKRQRTEKAKCVCSELQTVWISDSARSWIVIKNYISCECQILCQVQKTPSFSWQVTAHQVVAIFLTDILIIVPDAY
jgi:hypothetical protein